MCAQEGMGLSEVSTSALEVRLTLPSQGGLAPADRGGEK